MNQADIMTASNPVPGERLRHAREAQQMTIDDVATRLRLGAAKIEALERGEVGNIVAPVYLAGYLRAYARLLGLPADEIIREYESAAGMSAPSIDLSAVTVRAESASGIPLTGNKYLQSIVRWGGVALVLFVVIGAWWQLRGDEHKPAQTTVAQTLEVSPAAPAPEATDTQSATADAVTEAPSVAFEPPASEPQAPAPTAQLALTFMEESWVEVIDAQGNRLMLELAQPKQTRTLHGVAPFEVMLGYVPGVLLDYNGLPYDLSRYQKRRTAKFSVGAAGDRMNTD